MPRGDGTGPMGMGPMTGRAAGCCAGYPVPGFMNPYGGAYRGWAQPAPYGAYGAYGPPVPFAGYGGFGPSGAYGAPAGWGGWAPRRMGFGMGLGWRRGWGGRGRGFGRRW